ncbi:MAG: delta-60 repeat domain-containing protein [Proteobacteria bacterium]|nr:delta-60 repeat domain-containing protein [Pseudomonadota bacterium]
MKKSEGRIFTTHTGSLPCPDGLVALLGVVATDGSGDVYVGGTFSDYNGTATKSIVRLNSDGSIDTGFVTGSGYTPTPRSIALATDGNGDVYMGGSFTHYNGSSVDFLTRLTAGGVLVR